MWGTGFSCYWLNITVRAPIDRSHPHRHLDHGSILPPHYTARKCARPDLWREDGAATESKLGELEKVCSIRVGGADKAQCSSRIWPTLGGEIPALWQLEIRHLIFPLDLEQQG
jgi:hypothetical protein